MTKEIIFPFSYDGWDEQDTGFFSFYDVTMDNTWGPLLQGEKFKAISVNYNTGILEVYDSSGLNIKRTIKFHCVPA